MDNGAWRATGHGASKESDTTQWLNDSNTTSYPAGLQVHDGELIFPHLKKNWNTIALQCCVSFSITAWISYMYTNAPCLVNLPPTAPPHLTSVSHHRAPTWALCAVQQLPTSSLFTHGNVNMLMLLCHFVPLSLPPVSASLFSTSGSLLLPWK